MTVPPLRRVPAPHNNYSIRKGHKGDQSAHFSHSWWRSLVKLPLGSRKYPWNYSQPLQKPNQVTVCVSLEMSCEYRAIKRSIGMFTTRLITSDTKQKLMEMFRSDEAKDWQLKIELEPID